MTKTKTIEDKEVVYTGLIPQCPYCEKPTKREEGGSTSTLMNFSPVYDEAGNNTNPDRNITTTGYYCYGCNNSFKVSGNWTDGFKYRKA